MRTLRSLATIGFVFAMLGAAVSPSIALNLDKPIPMGKTKKQKEQEAAEKQRLKNDAQSMGTAAVARWLLEEKKKAELEAAKRLAAQKRVETMKKLTRHVPDWTTRRPKTETKTFTGPKITATATHQSQFKPIDRLVVKPPVASTAQPRGYAR